MAGVHGGETEAEHVAAHCGQRQEPAPESNSSLQGGTCIATQPTSCFLAKLDELQIIKRQTVALHVVAHTSLFTFMCESRVGMPSVICTKLLIGQVLQSSGQVS
jgi:hypothetical protein